MKTSDVLRVPKERYSASRMDRDAIKAAATDPDVEIITRIEEARDPNADHGSNKRKHMDVGARHLASED